jgi:hypothetical protein
MQIRNRNGGRAKYTTTCSGRLNRWDTDPLLVISGRTAMLKNSWIERRNLFVSVGCMFDENHFVK